MIDQLKSEEYTGNNRCELCTLVNIFLALVLSLVVGGIILNHLNTTKTLIVSGLVFTFCILLIWLRGYLIPKTPIITKKYVPIWVLRIFGKTYGDILEYRNFESFDGEVIEDILTNNEVLHRCKNKDDLCLTDSFLERWRQEANLLDNDPNDPDLVASRLDLTGNIDISLSENQSVDLFYNGSRIGAWPSTAALQADLASYAVLENQNIFDSLSLEQKLSVVSSIRLFLDECPESGDTILQNKRVESCCSEHKVVAVLCEENEQVLYEQPIAGL